MPQYMRFLYPTNFVGQYWYCFKALRLLCLKSSKKQNQKQFYSIRHWVPHLDHTYDIYHMNEWMTGLSKTQLSSCAEAHVIPCTQYNNNVVDCLAPLLVTTTCIYSLVLYSFSWYSKQWCVLNYYTAVILTTMALQLVTISLSKTQLSTNSLQYMAVPCRNHSVVYFELIVAYKVLYQWTSAMGGAHMLFLKQCL